MSYLRQFSVINQRITILYFKLTFKCLYLFLFLLKSVGQHHATASFMEAPTLIAIFVSVTLCVLLIVLIAIVGRRKRNQSDSKIDDSSMRPAATAPPTSQEPPPYYPASALHNKSIDHSIDLALTKDSQKEALYGTQNDYVYYPQPTHPMTDNECKWYIYSLLYIVKGILEVYNLT